MKINSAEKAAVIVAGVMSVLSVIGALIDFYFFEGTFKIDYIVYMICIFISGYFISRYVIRKFLSYRIKPLYQMVLSRDITNRELESTLIRNRNMYQDIGDKVSELAKGHVEAIARLKENETYRRQFVGNVYHELKTPIFNIQGYISTLIDGGLEDKGINIDYLKRAEKSVDRLINIVEDLEEITKLEAGNMVLNKTLFNIVELAEYIVDTISFEAGSRGIKIAIETPLNNLSVYADKRYIEQVLVNLIVNSIRYNKDNGSTRIVFHDMFDKIMVEISDTGIGITKEDLPHIFERFFRADKSRSRQQGGTGLGLAIVKHILEAHNENIVVRSEYGKGTTFSFVISK